jgi:hypothetical protein
MKGRQMNNLLNPMEPTINCFLDITDDYKKILLQAFDEREKNKSAIGLNLKSFLHNKKIVHMN